MTGFQKSLAGGAEWAVNLPCWVALQLCRGVAYVRSGVKHDELPVGTLLVIPPNSLVTVLASVLTEVNLRGCAIKVSSLNGLLTSAERLCLEKDAAPGCAPYCLLPASAKPAEQLCRFLERGSSANLYSRLALLQAFAEWLAPFLERSAAKWSRNEEETPTSRLKRYLNQVPESELVGLTLGDIARQLCCCERHASRLFHEVCGCSFRKYVSEIRLSKACQMLVQRDYKIIDVALESGHSSPALFNYNFKNRFRMTPTEWRERQLAGDGRSLRVGAQLAVA